MALEDIKCFIVPFKLYINSKRPINDNVSINMSPGESKASEATFLPPPPPIEPGTDWIVQVVSPSCSRSLFDASPSAHDRRLRRCEQASAPPPSPPPSLPPGGAASPPNRWRKSSGQGQSRSHLRRKLHSCFSLFGDELKAVVRPTPPPPVRTKSEPNRDGVGASADVQRGWCELSKRERGGCRLSWWTGGGRTHEAAAFLPDPSKAPLQKFHIISSAVVCFSLAGPRKIFPRELQMRRILKVSASIASQTCTPPLTRPLAAPSRAFTRPSLSVTDQIRNVSSNLSPAVSCEPCLERAASWKHPRTDRNGQAREEAQAPF